MGTCVLRISIQLSTRFPSLSSRLPSVPRLPRHQRYLRQTHQILPGPQQGGHPQGGHGRIPKGRADRPARRERVFRWVQCDASVGAYAADNDRSVVAQSALIFLKKTIRETEICDASKKQPETIPEMR